MPASVKRVLQITSYPPPRAGWGVRVGYVKQGLEAAGHTCVVLNLGQARKIASPEYETVMGGWDYVRKVWRFSRRGYLVHMHTNGESPKGFVLALLAEFINLLWGKRCVLTFHAGVDQVYFPRSKSPWLAPVYAVMFAIPTRIICNSTAVKEKILEYGVPADKVVPIPAFSRQYLEHQMLDLPAYLDEFYRKYAAVIFTYIRVREGFYLNELLDGFALVAARRSDVGLVLLGTIGDVEPPVEQELHKRLDHHQLRDRVCLVEDLDHDRFLVALKRSSLYLRTPTTDGVASSVLEALALKVPVVASENGSRPPGTILYDATDPADLARAVLAVLDDRRRAVDAIPESHAADTVATEVALLTA